MQDKQNRLYKSTSEELVSEIIPEGGIDTDFYKEIVKLLDEAAYFKRDKLAQIIKDHDTELREQIDKMWQSPPWSPEWIDEFYKVEGYRRAIKDVLELLKKDL